MQTQFLHIGFGNMLLVNKIVAILKPNPSHVRNIVREARERKVLISATQGKKVRSVILTSDGYVFLSTLNSESLAGRIDDGKRHPGSDS
ncbi:DUF370 domain-containing protein [bacterium]|nr:DUF370 domain-containing protein [bacterium]